MTASFRKYDTWAAKVTRPTRFEWELGSFFHWREKDGVK